MNWELKKLKAFKEKLIWEIDDEIEVPEKKIVKAEVIVSEEKHKMEFVVKTKVQGNVHCDVYDASTGDYVKALDGNVKTILDESAKRKAKSTSGDQEMSVWVYCLLFIWGFTSLSTLYRSYHDG